MDEIYMRQEQLKVTMLWQEGSNQHVEEFTIPLTLSAHDSVACMVVPYMEAVNKLRAIAGLSEILHDAHTL